jgi:hypothetical protein
MTQTPDLIFLISQCHLNKKQTHQVSAIGAILSQGKYPIAYFSKKLNPSMQKKSSYVRELYAIIEAMAKFKHYTFGYQFIIWTDQQSLRSPSDQNIQTPEQ